MMPRTAAAMVTVVMLPSAPMTWVLKRRSDGLCACTSPRIVTMRSATICTTTKKAATQVPSLTLRKLTAAAYDDHQHGDDVGVLAGPRPDDAQDAAGGEGRGRRDEDVHGRHQTEGDDAEGLAEDAADHRILTAGHRVCRADLGVGQALEDAEHGRDDHGPPAEQAADGQQRRDVGEHAADRPAAGDAHDERSQRMKTPVELLRIRIPAQLVELRASTA